MVYDATRPALNKTVWAQFLLRVKTYSVLSSCFYDVLRVVSSLMEVKLLLGV